MFEEPDLLGKRVIGDEIHIFKYNPETKCQGLQD
jgi:hypothetical protein